MLYLLRLKSVSVNEFTTSYKKKTIVHASYSSNTKREQRQIQCTEESPKVGNENKNKDCSLLDTAVVSHEEAAPGRPCRGRECCQARPGLTWWSPAQGWALQMGSLGCSGPGMGAASPLGRRWEWGDPVLSFYCPTIMGTEGRVGGREKVISVWFI